MKKYKVIKEIKPFRFNGILTGGLDTNTNPCDLDGYSDELKSFLLANGFIEEVKETKKRWRANVDEEYWYINYDYYNCVVISEEWKSGLDNLRYITGNYFKTKEEGEEYKNYLLADTKIKDWILENDEEGVEWENNDDYKYVIIYDYYSEKLNWILFANWKFNNYSVSSEELAKKLITECKEELLTVFKIK